MRVERPRESWSGVVGYRYRVVVCPRRSVRRVTAVENARSRVSDVRDCQTLGFNAVLYSVCAQSASTHAAAFARRCEHSACGALVAYVASSTDGARRLVGTQPVRLPENGCSLPAPTSRRRGMRTLRNARAHSPRAHGLFRPSPHAPPPRKRSPRMTTPNLASASMLELARVTNGCAH